MTSPSRTKAWLARLSRAPGGHLLLRLASTLLAPRHRVGVLVAVRDREERLLLLRHVFHPRSPWGLPGGWLHRGELPEQGAARELREETALVATELHFLFASLEAQPRHLAMVFEARGLDAEIRPGFEILEARYFAPAQLPEVFPIVHRAARESAP